ncbi:MAG: DUF6687 family protein [Dehalococcoidia bacterium]
MHYAPLTPALDQVPHVRVGGQAEPSTTLVLSNLPGAATPAELLADTNAEAALRLLRSDRRDGLFAGAEVATGRCCDTDTLLGVWSLLEPAEALTRADRVVDAARAGAFSVRRSPEAAQFACWLRGFRRDERLTDEAEAFQAMLPLVPRVLDSPRDWDLTWIGEYSDLIHDGAMLESGAVQIEEYPELDLAVMQTPLWLHDLVRYTAVSAFRLLTARSENTYVLEYRRESGVRYQSRRPLPRIDLRPLATRLNLFERGEGRWRADPVDAPAPRLLLDAGDARPAPSAIDAETVTAEVLDFFRANARRTDLHWSPYTAGRPGP